MLLQVIFEGLVMGTVYALISMGIALVWGVTNILSFAQGNFLMLAMYLTYFCSIQSGVDPMLLLPFVMVVMFVFGMGVYKLLIQKALKGPRLSQRLITFALGMVLTNLILMTVGGQYKNITKLAFEGSVNLGFVIVGKEKMIPLMVSLAVTVLLFLFLNYTKTGKSIRATAQDKEAAGLLGINTNRAFMLAFALSTSIAGAAGCALSYYYYIYPTVGDTFQIFGFIAVCIGGFGSIGGAFFAGILIGLIDLVAGTYLSTAYKYVIICLFFMLIVSFKPKGIFNRG